MKNYILKILFATIIYPCFIGQVSATTSWDLALDKKDSTLNNGLAETKQNLINDEITLHSIETVNLNFDFSLRAIETGKFNLSFYNNTNSRWIDIKVYDLIGNLVIEDKVKTEGFFTKNYDLSFLQNKFFVVAVGNAKYNKTKKVFTSI